MKFSQCVLTLLFCGCLALGALANDGWGRDSAYTKLYNTETVKTVTGKIESIDRAARPLKGMAPGFSVVVKDDSGAKTEAQIGPAWFTSFYKEKWNAKVGDKVTITGSVVDVGGKPVMIVRQGSKGELQMTCRNQNGLPVWDLDVSDF